LEPENRSVEPWTASVLSYLNHPLRQREALAYIRPGLEELPEIQQTGDIFFPKNWCVSLLRGHDSPEATAQVKAFLQENPDFPQLLKAKLLQSADHLLR
jgi:aminopeptidase N